MDDARKIDDALLRAFCAVQALCAGAIGIAYPAVLCALATWIFRPFSKNMEGSLARGNFHIILAVVSLVTRLAFQSPS